MSVAFGPTNSEVTPPTTQPSNSVWDAMANIAITRPRISSDVGSCKVVLIRFVHHGIATPIAKETAQAAMSEFTKAKAINIAEKNNCAARGLPMFLDKPLAGSPEDISDIRSSIRDAGVPAQMYSFTSTPWAKAAKAAVQSGELGDLIAVHAEVMFAKGGAGTAPGGIVRREHETPERFTFTEAKRELFDLGIYPIVLCLWLADSPVKRVSAITANYFFAEHANVDIEDFGALTIEFENGVVGSAIGGRIGFYSHPKIGPHGVTVSGSGGTKTFSVWDPHIEVFSDEPQPVLPTPHPEDPMSMWRSTQVELGVPRKTGWLAFEDESDWGAHEVSSFLDCLDADRTPDVGVDLAAAATEVVLAAYRSAARADPVQLD